MIVYYKANVDGKEEFKVDWKKVEQHVKAEFKKLKLIYARGGQVDGHLAFSSVRLNEEEFDSLCKHKKIPQVIIYASCKGVSGFDGGYHCSSAIGDAINQIHCRSS